MTTDYAYDRADQLQQQTIGVTTHSFDYDRHGNLTSSWDAASAQTTYGYDAASRLTGITPPAGGAVSFTIDALDRPATRSVAGSGTSDNYGYVGPSETAYLTGAGTTTGSLLDAEGSRLAVKTGSSVSWLVFDLHGSVAGLCPSGTSTLADAYRYDGWGRQVAKAGSSTNPFRYRGLLNLGYDDLSGALLAMGAREYSSQLGTFTQEDSVAGSAANPATMNRFLYALANPATLVDPDGHRAILDEGDRVIPLSNDLPTAHPVAPWDPSRVEQIAPLIEGATWWITAGPIRDLLAGPYRDPHFDPSHRDLYVAAGGIGLDAASRNLDDYVDDLERQAAVARSRYEQAMLKLHSRASSGAWGRVSGFLSREWDHTAAYFGDKLVRLPLLAKAKAAAGLSKALRYGGVVLMGADAIWEQEDRDTGRIMSVPEKLARDGLRFTLAGGGGILGIVAGAEACGGIGVFVCGPALAATGNAAGNGLADRILGMIDEYNYTPKVLAPMKEY